MKGQCYNWRVFSRDLPIISSVVNNHVISQTGHLPCYTLQRFSPISDLLKGDVHFKQLTHFIRAHFSLFPTFPAFYSQLVPRKEKTQEEEEGREEGVNKCQGWRETKDSPCLTSLGNGALWPQQLRGQRWRFKFPWSDGLVSRGHLFTTTTL